MALVLRIAFSALVLSCSACAFLREHGIEFPQPAPPQANPEPVAETGGKEMPFTMKILDEVNDGKELHIHASVTARTSWDPKTVVVRLTGLNHGDVVGVSYHTLAKLLGSDSPFAAADSIHENAEVNFSLSVPAKDMSDYQLELLWGSEAREVLGSGKANEKLLLTVREIEIDTLRGDCSYPPCDIRFRVNGRFYNEGNAPIGSVVLGVAFVPSDFPKDMVPQQEERVDVPNLNLAPGKSKPFRVLLQQELHEDEAQHIRPVLRVISFAGVEQ